MNIDSKLTSFNPTITVSQLETIDQLFKNAQSTTKVSEKRVQFEAIYQILRTQTSPEPQQLSRLFEEYASQTCYSQSYDDEGYRKSARLMELNFQMQLAVMNLGTFNYDWKKHETLEDLIADLGIENGQKGVFFDKISGLIIDEDVLVQQAGDLRDTLAKTLLRLSYSYQNINAVSDSEHLALHQKLNTWTEKVIGEDTQEQKEMLVDYHYNRCSFLVRLKGGDFISQIKSYDGVLDTAQRIYPPDSLKLLSLIAQTDNMRGLTLLRTNQIDHQLKHVMAQEYFSLALEARTKLVIDDDQAKLVIDNKQKAKNQYLLANLRTGIIQCLLTVQPVKEESIQKALHHSEALKLYYPTNPKDDYAPSWVQAILIVEAVAGKFGIQVKTPLKL